MKKCSTQSQKQNKNLTNKKKRCLTFGILNKNKVMGFKTLLKSEKTIQLNNMLLASNGNLFYVIIILPY